MIVKCFPERHLDPSRLVPGLNVGRTTQMRHDGTQEIHGEPEPDQRQGSRYASY